ncbi:MAG: hypothetical protein Q4B65_00835, partial [Candidatus Saccharibacteria bacterium]|nr:hypothetical protein [Candidatus Saccharibacteria bacterium]
MNENPEGTPNPLNPNPTPGVQLDLAGPAPAPEPVVAPEVAPILEPASEPAPMPAPGPIETPEPVIAPEPVVEPMPEPAPAPTPMPPKPFGQAFVNEPVIRPVAPAEPAVEPMPEPVAVQESTQPTMVAPDSVVAPEKGKKKKKTAWIITGIVAFLVAIGCAVAAILILNPFGSSDAVNTAITRLIKGETPKNVAFNGIVNATFDDIYSDDESLSLEGMRVSFNSQIATAHNTNSTTANVLLAFEDNIELAVDIKEVMVSDGDAYIMLDGISQSIEDMIIDQADCVVDAEEEGVDCVEISTAFDFSALGETGEALAQLQEIEGQWIRLSSDYLGDSLSSLLYLESMLSGFESSQNDVADLYTQNPFITSSEDTKIASKSGTIYKLGIDTEKLTSFIQSIPGFSSLAGSMISSEDLEELTASLPAIYAEVNDKGDFSRLYVDTFSMDGANTFTIDLSITYPETIEVTEPGEYVDIDDAMVQLYNLETCDINGTDC